MEEEARLEIIREEERKQEAIVAEAKRVADEIEQERQRIAEEIRLKEVAEAEYQRKLREPSATMIEEQEIFESLQEMLYVNKEEEDDIVLEQRSAARDRQGIFLENVDGF